MAANPTRGSIKRRQRYPHEPLRSGDGEDEVRMLYLLPGNWRSPIRVILSVHRCKRLRRVWYEAVSYVCGAETNPATIHIIDGPFSWTLDVTQNCVPTLRHLRYRYRDRPLWLDAVCIDQNNLQERAHQVQLMTAIYRRAARVLCWLGPRSPDSDVAMSAIRDVSSHVAYDEVSDDIQAINNGREAQFWTQGMGKAPFSAEQVSALANLLALPWFSRLWIGQEVHMGDKRSSLICGRCEVRWYQFRAFVLAGRGKTFTGSDSNTFVSTKQLVNALCERAFHRQLDQLRIMRLSGCQSPSDRLYTSQALATMPDHIVYMTPDYTKSYQEVFLEWATKYILQKNDLDLVLHVGHLDSCSSLPSWVPDWSKRRQTRPDDIRGIANGRAKSAIVDVDSRWATVKRVLVGTVARVVPSGLSLSMTSTKELTKHLSRLAATTLDIMSPSELARLAMVLCVGDVNDNMAASGTHRRNLSELTSTLLRIIEDPNSTLEPLEEYCIGEMADLLASRCMLIIKDNTLGLGPPCEEGDAVSILLGCRLPLVIRPLENGTFRPYSLS